MSTSRDGSSRGGRGRDTAFNSGAPRSTPRGRGGPPSAGRGGFNTNRGTSSTSFGGTGAPAPRGRGRGRGQASTAMARPALGRAGAGLGGVPTTGKWQERQEKLKAHREQERKDAIAQGLMTDPDKAVSLADAITLVGTCQGMCSEYEMVLRVNRNEVFPEEKVNGDPNGEPDESRFVKIFRRSEAGAEAQLPSDLRPPAVLKKTCDYLFNDIVGDAPFLGKVHHFVWDRTRAIRNDFSIQQLSKLDDLRIAVECYERIARFHIMSLHQLALEEKPYDKYDPHQEREQLDRTLLSLMQYYDDTRGRLENSNEAEFRAYCVIFAITNPAPDLEDRVQTWPREIIKDRRVQTALELYAAACQTTWAQGPSQPPAKPVIARQDWQKFWSLVKSRKMSYLASCVSEIFFNLIREVVLKSLVRSSRTSRKNTDGTILPNTELTLDDLLELLQYDDEDDLYSFAARWNLEFKSTDDDMVYLDIRHVAGTNLPEPKAGPTQQKSSLVEKKRFGRTLPAIIDGFSVRQAADKGMVVEEEQEEEMEDVEEVDVGDIENEGEETEEEGDSLFVGQPKNVQEQSQQAAGNDNASNKLPASVAKPTGFGLTGTAFGSTAFGAPLNAFNNTSTPFGSSGFGSSGFGQPSNAFNAIKPPESTQQENGAAAPKPAFGDASDLFSKPASKNNPFALSTFGAPATGAPKANAFAPATTPSLSANTNVFASAANPLVPSASFGSTARPDATAPKPAFGATSAFGVPFTAAQPAADPAEPPKPKTPSPVKKAPFEEEESPTKTSPKTPEFSHAGEASKLQSSTLQQTSDNPAAPSLSARSETNSNPAPAQQSLPQTAAPTSTPSPPPPSQPLPSGAQSPTKRRSSDWEHKPKRPSPLSNSFTATEDSTIRATQAPSVDPVAAPARPLPPPEKTADEVLSEIAESITWDPAWGVWKQWVDFQIKQAIEAALEKVRDEKCQALLKIISARRFLRWLRELVRKRKLKEKGKAARERTRRRLQESIKSNGSSASTMGNSASSVDASRAASTPQTNGVKRGNADLLLQSIARGRQSQLDGQVHAGSKRSASAYGSDQAASTNPPMHKRQKSMSHVEDRSKIIRPTPTNDSDDDVLKRSSFLGFTSRDAQHSVNTTKSTYFRMKALGLQARDGGTGSGAARGTKRQRSESLDTASMPPPPRPNAPMAMESSPEAPSVASARSVRAKTDEEDEILFARLRAAREALRDGEKDMREEVAREELRRSMNESQSSNESPSLARARADARLRASRGNSESRERDVPAYRLRESRFVPREEYHLAEERARQMRASRANSRAGSREGSRPPAAAESTAVTTKDRDVASMLFDSPAKPVQPTKPSSGFDAQPPTTSTPSFGFGTQSRAPAVQPAVPELTQRNPFSQSSSFAPPMNGQNPFLQTFGATNVTPFDDIPQDNTLPPSQINGTLARSFGQPPHAAQSPTPPQANSYMPSQAASEAISLLSDDEDEAPEQTQQETQGGEVSYGQQAFLDQETNNDINAAFGERSATVSFDQQDAASQALLRGAYDYASNPFAALADGGSEDEQSEEVADDEDEPKTAPQPDSYQYSDDEEVGDPDDGSPVGDYSDDELAPNGYVDDEAQDEDDIEVEDDDLEDDDGQDDEDELGEVRPDDWDSEQDGHWEFSDADDDEEEPHSFAPLNSAYNQRVMQAAPEKDPALQLVGNTEEEAIELSD